MRSVNKPVTSQLWSWPSHLKSRARDHLRAWSVSTSWTDSIIGLLCLRRRPHLRLDTTVQQQDSVKPGFNRSSTRSPSQCKPQDLSHRHVAGLPATHPGLGLDATHASGFATPSTPTMLHEDERGRGGLRKTDFEQAKTRATFAEKTVWRLVPWRFVLCTVSRAYLARPLLQYHLVGYRTHSA